MGQNRYSKGTADFLYVPVERHWGSNLPAGVSLQMFLPASVQEMRFLLVQVFFMRYIKAFRAVLGSFT